MVLDKPGDVAKIQAEFNLNLFFDVENFPQTFDSFPGSVSSDVRR